MSTAQKKKNIIRKYTTSDKPHIIELYKKIWGRESADKIAKIWDWKYHDHPFQTEDTLHSLVAEKSGKIVGFLGAIPVKLKLGGGIHEAFWLGDLMMDPDHRGFLGVRLARTILATEPILIGHADTGSDEGAIAYKLWMRLLYTKLDVSKIHNLIKRVSIEVAVQRKVKSRMLAALADRLWKATLDSRWDKSIKKGLEIVQINRFTDEHRSFLDDLISQLENTPERSPEAMSWRFLEHPGTSYTVLLAKRDNKPVGYIIIRFLEYEGELHGRVVDILAKKEDTACFQFLLKAAENIFWKNKVTIVRAYGSPAFSIDVLRRAGFSSKNVPDPIYPAIGQCPYKNFYNQDAWHLSLADSDFDMD